MRETIMATTSIKQALIACCILILSGLAGYGQTPSLRTLDQRILLTEGSSAKTYIIRRLAFSTESTALIKPEQYQGSISHTFLNHSLLKLFAVKSC